MNVRARSARLVVVTAGGDLLGSLPPFPVDTPWWPDADAVVRGAREHHGADVVVLRLLAVEPAVGPGGEVTYLVEHGPSGPPKALEPWAGQLDEHPLRAPYARPGGPAADLAWADDRLAEAGLRRTGPASQARTWNLSSLWRLPVGDETVWLKHVPPFFAHEGAILARLAGGPVPSLVAAEGGRILMREIAGQDLYAADQPVLERLVDVLVGLQRDWIGRVDELLALGLPDWRGPALGTKIAYAIDRTSPVLALEDRQVLAAFVDELPGRFKRIADAGIPDTLVHGDFHPGNARGHGTSIVLLDWGDSGVGHPLLDQAAFLDRVSDDALPAIRDRWHAAWRRVLPGSDPEHASTLLAPVAAARQAVIYCVFLDGIEPSEHPYHAPDPADWLTRTARLARANP